MVEAVSARRLRTLIVTPKGFIGGAEKWLLSLLDETDRLEPHVICLDGEGPLTNSLRERGVSLTLIPTGPRGQDVVATAIKIRSIFKSTDPDVVLANGIKAAAAAIPVASWLGVPSVWVRHDPNFDLTLGRIAGRLASKVIVVAPATSIEERRLRPIFIPPPLTTEPLAPTLARERLLELGVPVDGRPLVGMFCRLARYKGIDIAIRSLPHAEPWRLVVAGIVDPGDQGEGARLIRLAEECGVADRVSWLGDINSVGALASGLDALAILTRAGEPGYPAAEGFPLNLMEAYSAGVPLIGDPRTVPPLQHAEYAAAAVLVDATDEAVVALALASLLDDPDARARAQRARQLAEDHPRGKQVASAVVDVMCGVSRRPGAGLAVGPPVSVVATVLNEGDGVDVLLDSVLSQAGQTDEFIVVDGGSQDDTLERLKRRAKDDERLIVVDAPGAGISRGRNIGVGRASNEWIACTDAGCRPSASWLASFRTAAEDGRGDLLTGTYHADHGQHRVWETALAAVAYPQTRELRRPTPLVRTYGRLFGRVFDATLPTGRSVAFTQSAWRLAGGYPEDLTTAEDVTFGQRVVASGGRAELVAGADVAWAQRDTFGANVKMFYRYGIGDGQSGDARLIGRNVGRAVAYLAGPAALIASRRTRMVALLGAAAYMSLPVRRAASGPRPVATVLAVPVVAAIRDTSKAMGCLVGLLRRP